MPQITFQPTSLQQSLDFIYMFVDMSRIINNKSVNSRYFCMCYILTEKHGDGTLFQELTTPFSTVFVWMK